jgi:acyl carrier protein
MTDNIELTESQISTPKPTTEFKKIVKDFIGDIQNTFPEYKGVIAQWWNIENEEDSIQYIYNYCIRVYPERIFEILYQNDELFSEDNSYNTEFLPGISFKYIWSSNITENTRNTIWKYLQLIVISLIDTIKDKTVFGDTAKLLETMDCEDFKTKLEETLDNIQTLFTREKGEEGGDENDGDSGEPKFQLPSSDDIQSHISGMLKGKLGDLAKEIAEETAESMNLDIDEDVSDPAQVFKNLFSDPSKLMSLVQNVGSKLDTKIKSGEIDQTDLFTEATQMMSKMKSIPGMDNIQELISKMGMGIGKDFGKNGLGGQNNKNTRVDHNAMDQQLKKMGMREKLKKKLEERHMNKLMNEASAEILKQQQPLSGATAIEDEELVSMFQDKNKKPKKKKSKASVESTSS